jgi:alanine-synthesizing transaminase
MELRRVDSLPPYALGRLRELTLQLRRDGVDVVDLGFGNPDLPPPACALLRLAAAVDDPSNHRYSTSRGLPNLRAAIAERYRAYFNVDLDPEHEVVHTIGAKEGCAHLMWLLLEPGDVALVPTPAYPSHLQAPALAGASVETFPVDPATFIESAAGAYESAVLRHGVRPRVLLFSFPNNPTTATVDPKLMHRIVEFARERSLFLVHDFAYADLGFDGYRPPSLLEVEGARECSVELYTMTKSFSMAGWRSGFALGNAKVLAGFVRLKSWLDYGSFQPLQIAAITALRETPDYPDVLCEQYRARRDVLCAGLEGLGWSVEAPQATMFVWAEIPGPYRSLGSVAFSELLLMDAAVTTSPGVSFGPGGEGFMRFALVENEQRIRQALRGMADFFRMWPRVRQTAGQSS